MLIVNECGENIFIFEGRNNGKKQKKLSGTYRGWRRETGIGVRLVNVHLFKLF